MKSYASDARPGLGGGFILSNITLVKIIANLYGQEFHQFWHFLS